MLSAHVYGVSPSGTVKSGESWRHASESTAQGSAAVSSVVSADDAVVVGAVLPSTAVAVVVGDVAAPLSAGSPVVVAEVEAATVVP